MQICGGRWNAVKRRVMLALCFAGSLLCIALARAQEPATAPEQGIQKSDQPPDLATQHENIDWTYYCDRSHRSEYTDELKCKSLNASGSTTLSIGGEERERGDYFDHATWGQDPPDSGFSLQRYMLYGDLRLGSRLRLFEEFESGLEFGRDGGPRPSIDRNTLFVHQSFIDLKFWSSGEDFLRLRLGRQELSFGAERLVGIREGPNVRQNFDGLRLTLKKMSWTTDLLAAKYDESNPGIFDDWPNHAITFWGLYATHPVSFLGKATLDLYYLGVDKKKAVYSRGVGREQRETVGARLAGKHGNFDHDTEANFQFGRFGPGNIRAWTLTTNSGYTFSPASSFVETRLAFEGGIASGDTNRTGHPLGTYNALFPRGAYFSEAQLLGPYNVYHARPNVKLFFPRHISLWQDVSPFWRQSPRDGIYGVPEALLRPAGNTTARYIGTHVNTQIDWHATRHFTYTLIYLHFFPGAYLKKTLPDKSINFVSPWITYTF